MKTPRLLLPAEEEMLEAAFYYEQQSKGLGQDFLRKVQNAVDEIVQHPTRMAQGQRKHSTAHDPSLSLCRPV